MSCGPTRYDKYIPDFHFSTCCDLHDIEYDKIILLGKRLISLRCSNEYTTSVNNFLLNQIIEKLKLLQVVADKQFLSNMLRRNSSLTLSLPKKRFYDFIAYSYYYGVKAKGFDVIIEGIL